MTYSLSLVILSKMTNELHLVECTKLMIKKCLIYMYILNILTRNSQVNTGVSNEIKQGSVPFGAVQMLFL